MPRQDQKEGLNHEKEKDSFNHMRTVDAGLACGLHRGNRQSPFRNRSSGSSVVNAADKDYSGKTVAGKVTAIDGSVVTLQLGELSENAEGNTPPEKPSGDAGENANSAPEASGSSNTQNTPPERPAGESSDSQATPSEKPSGSPGSAQTFTAGNENTTVDLSTAQLTENSETISVSDIKENDILKITFDNSNFASLVEVVAVGGAAEWE